MYFRRSTCSCDLKSIVLVISFDKSKIPNNLPDYFSEVGGGGIFLFFLYSKNKGRGLIINIHQYSDLKVNLGDVTYI